MAEKTAFVIVDMLNDFVREGAPLEVPKTREVLPNIRRELERARREGMPVVYLCDRHKPDDPEFKVWPPHAVEGTEGAEVVQELAPQEGDLVIPKVSYSGFFRTDLEDRLRELGVEKLIITGCVTNICVLYTSVDALMRGYEVEVLEDCVAALDEEDGRFALKQIREVLKPRR
ncbi:MAG: cysteine hydrolase [Candidatus Latescibacterota bacterium]|nr:MAG: cysteine hydrolase [Candidatus Latescibacterota bacterium]